MPCRALLSVSVSVSVSVLCLCLCLAGPESEPEPEPGPLSLPANDAAACPVPFFSLSLSLSLSLSPGRGREKSEKRCARTVGTKDAERPLHHRLVGSQSERASERANSNHGRRPSTSSLRKAILPSRHLHPLFFPTFPPPSSSSSSSSSSSKTSQGPSTSCTYPSLSSQKHWTADQEPPQTRDRTFYFYPGAGF